MKHLDTILRATAGTLLTLYLVLLVAANAPACQQWLGRVASRQLTAMLGARTEVERVEVELFNQITLHGVSLDDPQGKPVVRSQYLSGKIELIPLLRDRSIRLRTAALLDTEASLRRDSAGRLNIQYLIDAFSDPNDTTPSRIDLAVGAVIMRRCRMTYTDVLNPQAAVSLADIDLNMQISRLTNEGLSLRLRHCSLNGRRGLRLKELAFQLDAGRQSIQLEGLRLRLPQSELAMDKLTAHYSLPSDSTGLAGLLPTLNLRPFSLTAQLHSADFAFLMPERVAAALRRTPLGIGTALKGEMAGGRLTVSRLRMNEAGGLLDLDLSGQLHLTSEGKPHDGKASIDRLHIAAAPAVALCNALLGKELPKPLEALQDVDVSGQASLADATHARADLRLATALGTAQLNASLKGKTVSGTLTARNLKPDAALPGKGLPENISFDINGTALTDGSHLAGALNIGEMRWLGVDFHNIHMGGSMTGGNYAVHIGADDSHTLLDLTASGTKGLTDLKVDADIGRWQLFLPDNIKRLSGQLSADLHGIRTKAPTGQIALTDFTAITQAGDTLQTDHIPYLTLDSQPSASGINVKLDSPFIRGTFDGPFNWAALKATAMDIASRHLPALPADAGRKEAEGRWQFAMSITNDDVLQNLLTLPIDLAQPLTAEGYLDGGTRQASLQMSTPELSIKGQKVERLRIYAASHAEGSEALIQLQKPSEAAPILLDLKAQAKGGELLTHLAWQQQNHGTHCGEVALNTLFSRNEDGQPVIDTHLLPTDFMIGDTLWHISSGQLHYAAGQLDVRGCEVAHGLSQRARIDGRYGGSASDSIVAQLHNLDVKYILDLVSFDDVVFEGEVSGTAVVKMQDGQPLANFDLSLPHLYFNYTDMGEAAILGSFDGQHKQINLNADIAEKGISRTQVHGYVNLDERTIDLQFQANRTPMGFINWFVEGALEKIEGRATGPFRLYGGLKKLEFGGDLVADAAFGIPATGTSYNVKGLRARFTPGLIAFADGQMDDSRKGTGTVWGRVTHNHIKNMTYRFVADVKNMLVYDMPREVGSNFYSTAYGDGHVEINGRSGFLQTDLNFTPTAGTDFTFINDSPETVNASRLVTFGSKARAQSRQPLLPYPADRKNQAADSFPYPADSFSYPADSEQAAKDKENVPNESTTDIRINFNINVNPSAALHIIMDEKTGDVINLYGKGAVNATWYNKGDFRMYGTCTVDHGQYRFSLQDVIRKNFQLKPGGEVVFTGNPREADLNVQAIYTVNSASLADLNAGAEFSDNSVRVNCLLNIQGQAAQPQISFDLDLPNVNDDEKQMIRKLIATEEDMNMQIIYLLGVGRFYTYDTANLTPEQQNNVAANSMNSFLTNTLSSQFNELLASALKSNNWTLGANVATGTLGWNDVEVEALLSGRLFNNRLLLNGQFGYRDRAYMPTSTSFIGDFDIQYLLTKNGNVRLKAYSETNDRYFTRTALTTQGIGILLQKDFDRLGDIIKRKKMKKKQ